MEWLTLKWSATLLWLTPPICMPTACHHSESRRARQQPFSTAGALRGNLAFGGHINTRTVIRRLHHQGMRVRRPIKRPQLTLRHRHARFDWSVRMLMWPPNAKLP
jgi:hypothetical protein